MLGTIFDIKEFSIYDGPGMRVTVFFKGCPLRCLWCHNPEGLERDPQIMVSRAACQNCGKCDIDGCTRKLSGRCDACGKCVPVCPAGLRRIAGEEFTPERLNERIMSYSGFFGEYDAAKISDPEAAEGGVTFSGGEPLMQADFLCRVLDLLPGNIHKAVQTCGFASESDFLRVLERVDYIFFDIKHADSAVHRRLTGVPNEPILRNLELLKASGKPYVVRIPLISGVNADRGNLEATAALICGDDACGDDAGGDDAGGDAVNGASCDGAGGLLRVELLPYNGAAGGKYEMVGKEFSGVGFETPEKASVDLSVFEKRGITVKIL